MNVDEPVHHWFGLSYASHAVFNRSLLQSMPIDWQRRFVGCLEELDDAYSHLHHPYSYMVRARDQGGRFVAEPVPHYNRGRTYIEPVGPTSDAPE